MHNERLPAAREYRLNFESCRAGAFRAAVACRYRLSLLCLKDRQILLPGLLNRPKKLGTVSAQLFHGHAIPCTRELSQIAYVRVVETGFEIVQKSQPGPRYVACRRLLRDGRRAMN